MLRHPSPSRSRTCEPVARSARSCHHSTSSARAAAWTLEVPACTPRLLPTPRSIGALRGTGLSTGWRRLVGSKPGGGPVPTTTGHRSVGTSIARAPSCSLAIPDVVRRWRPPLELLRPEHCRQEGEGREHLGQFVQPLRQSAWSSQHRAEGHRCGHRDREHHRAAAGGVDHQPTTGSGAHSQHEPSPAARAGEDRDTRPGAHRQQHPRRCDITSLAGGLYRRETPAGRESLACSVAWTTTPGFEADRNPTVEPVGGRVDLARRSFRRVGRRSRSRPAGSVQACATGLVDTDPHGLSRSSWADAACGRVRFPGGWVIFTHASHLPVPGV